MECKNCTTISTTHKYAVSKQLTTTPGPLTRPWDFGDWSLLILFIFGTIGNALSILVMNKKRMRNTNATLFVTSIAISDTILLLFKLIGNIVKIYRISVYDFCILIQIIPQAAMFISVWLIMFMGVERMIAVRYPLQVAFIFSKRRCKVIISIMILFFAILSSSTSICIEHVAKQPYYCQIKGTQNGTCFVYYTYVFPLFKSIFASWVPSILGVCLNILIIIALYKASAQRKDITNQLSLGASGSFNSHNRGTSKGKAAFRNTTRSHTPTAYPVIGFRFASSADRLARQRSKSDNENYPIPIPVPGSAKVNGVVEPYETGLPPFTPDLTRKNKRHHHHHSFFFRKKLNSQTDSQSRHTNQSKDDLTPCMLNQEHGDYSDSFHRGSVPKRLQSRMSIALQPHHSMQQPKEKQITIMLLTISIAFIMLTLPYTTFELFRKLGSNWKLFKNRYALRFCMFLIDLNHSTNFVIYFLSTQRFRNELKGIFCQLFGIKSAEPLPHSYHNCSLAVRNHNLEFHHHNQHPNSGPGTQRNSLGGQFRSPTMIKRNANFE